MRFRYIETRNIKVGDYIEESGLIIRVRVSLV
jgi:hypothetical protein